MNFKRLRALLFLACLLLSMTILFIACDKSGEESGNSNSSGSNSEQTTENDCQHLNTQYVIDKATCTKKGMSNKVCTDCDEIIEEVELNTVAHTEEIIEGKAASCYAEGLTEGKKCSVCDTVIIEQQPISKIKHTEIVIPSVGATCTEKGYTAGKKCSVCGDILLVPEEIPALDHNESEWIIDEVAKIGVAGKMHTECTLCHIPMNEDIIPALEQTHVHNGDKWVVTTPATCTSQGIETLQCSCGTAMDTRVVDKLPHTEEKLLGISATCYSTGLTEGKKCSVCNTVLVSQSTIAKSTHTEEIVLGKAPSCTEYGYTDGSKCSVCKEILSTQLQIPPTGHTFDVGTCTVCGAKAENFSVWIVDGLGNPVKDIIVKILKDDEVVKMYPYNGEHLPFSIEKDTYRIELDLSQAKKQYVYDESLCVLTPENTNAVIKLYEKPDDPTLVFVSYPMECDYDAYGIGTGSYLVSLKQDDYTFFIFRPTKAAIYTLTYECTSDLTVSYHGSSFFVQGYDLSESSSDISIYENGLSVAVYASNVGSDYVFAIKSTSATSCVLKIANAGSPGTRLEDEPWTPYLEDESTVQKQLSTPKDGEYTVIDITDASLEAVFNEDDGYYHLGSEDGPIIFIDLTTDSRFVSSIQIICAHQRMGTYIYDINGKVSEKRSYNELFFQYGMPDTTESVAQPIRIPLTKKLAEAVQSFGNKNSWWAEGSDANIFDPVLLGVSYNVEYAWLLFCGYYS